MSNALVAPPDKENVTKIVRENIARESRLHTDESRLYIGSDQHFASHGTVKHSGPQAGVRTERQRRNVTHVSHSCSPLLGQ
jgi:hypothetical protein